MSAASAAASRGYKMSTLHISETEPKNPCAGDKWQRPSTGARYVFSHSLWHLEYDATKNNYSLYKRITESVRKILGISEGGIIESHLFDEFASPEIVIHKSVIAARECERFKVGSIITIASSLCPKDRGIYVVVKKNRGSRDKKDVINVTLKRIS